MDVSVHPVEDVLTSGVWPGCSLRSLLVSGTKRNSDVRDMVFLSVV